MNPSVMAFFAGLATGAVGVWCWAMCREIDETAAVMKQFDEELSQSMRQSTAMKVVEAINRTKLRLRQHAAVDAARAREGRGPFLFYRRAAMDNDGETFI